MMVALGKAVFQISECPVTIAIALKGLLTAATLSNISSRTNSCKNIPSTVERARLADLALMLKSSIVVIGLG
ncbi:MAG: hypothetical protein RI861_10730, partial [Planktomarina sp.]|nr:hypothetical protein [Planktomarina sp.]